MKMDHSSTLALQLESMAFMEPDVLSTTSTLLRGFANALRWIPIVATRDRSAAWKILRVIEDGQNALRSMLRAANATISLAKGRHELAAYYANRLLRRPPNASQDEWLSSVAEVLLQLLWLGADFKGITRYIWQAAQNVHVRQYLHGGLIPKSDALYSQPVEEGYGRADLQPGSDDDRRQLVRLEAVAERADEAVLEPWYSERSVAELRGAIAHDARLTEYLDGISSHPGWTRGQIWAELGWSEQEGKRVDRAFRRVRKYIGPDPGELGSVRDLHQLSDASRTTCYEPLFDGSRGLGVGVWQHRALMGKL